MRLVVCLLFLSINAAVQGQQYNVYPDNFILYYNNISLINPSYIAEKGSFILSSSYKMRLGEFSKIATYSFTAEKIIKTEKARSHCIRGFFFNEKEGPYIARPRAYLNYAYSIGLLPEVRLNLGVCLGFAGTYIDATSATSTSSRQVPDGSIGIMVLYKGLVAGAGIQQIFNSVAVPISAKLLYKRYYTMLFSYKKDLAQQLQARVGYQGHLYQEFRNKHIISTDVTFRNLLGLGAGYQYNQGIFFFTKLNAPIGSNALAITIGYFTSKGTNTINGLQLLELSLQYSFL